MPVFLQLAGFACLVFAYTLMCRPKVRPSPATYGFAIAVDCLCVAFILGVTAVWPSPWLLIPMALWGIALWVHIGRYRDARVMVRVLEANHPAVWAPQRDRPAQYAEDYYRDHEDWPPDWHR